MFESILLPIFGSILGAGGIGAIIVTAVINRKRNHAETEDVKVNTNSTSIENSIKMENLMFERYVSTDEKLKAVEQLLGEVRNELEQEREYIEILRKYIREKGFEPPERPDFN